MQEFMKRLMLRIPEYPAYIVEAIEETQSLAELDSLFSSLQHQAFRGELSMHPSNLLEYTRNFGMIINPAHPEAQHATNP